MIQTGNVNDLKTGIGTGEAQVLEGFKVTPASNDAANNILANRRLESDKAEKKAKQEQELKKGVNLIDYTGSLQSDIPIIQAAILDVKQKILDKAPEIQIDQMTNKVAEMINGSRLKEVARKDYDKTRSSDNVVKGNFEMTDDAEKAHSDLVNGGEFNNVNDIPAWEEMSKKQLDALNANKVPLPAHNELAYQKKLGARAAAFRGNNFTTREIPDPNNPGMTIVVNRSELNGAEGVEADFIADPAMFRSYSKMLKNNPDEAKKYGYIKNPTSEEDINNNYNAAKKFAVARNEKFAGENINKQELQGSKEDDNSGSGNGVYKSNGMAYSTNNLQGAQSDKPMGQRQLDELDALVALASSKDAPQSEQQNLGQHLQNNTNFTSVLAIKPKGGEGKELSPIDFTDISGKQRSAKFMGYSSGLAVFGEKVNLGNGVTAEKLYEAPYDKVKGKVMAQLGNDIKKINEGHVKGTSPGGATMQTKTSNTNVQTGGKKKKAHASNYGI